MRTPTPTRSLRRRRSAAALALSAAVALGASGSVPGRTGAPPPHPGLADGMVRSAAPTSSTTPSTTAPLPPLGWGYQVATARGDVTRVRVHADPPAGAVLDERVSSRWDAWEAEHLPPRSPTAAGLSPLPGLGRNLAGRIGVEGGWVFTNPNSFGTPPVFWVVEDHGEWLRVQVPARPNGTTGWVHSSEVHVEERTTRVVVEVGATRLRVLDGDAVLLETPVVVGAPGSPTPTGRLYVTHHETPADPAGAYGPAILGLSGYSETLETFSGGAPSLALHGTNRPELAGQHRSNGCVRVPNDALLLLRELAPPGTVVDIHP